jgi:hypothetical protein
MRSIRQRADKEFLQALKCVEYRVPDSGQFRPKGFLLAVALRYGLVGSAVSHHLLLETDSIDELPVLDSIARCWPSHVEKHVDTELRHRLAVDDEPRIPELVAQWARRPLQIAVPLYRRMCPLEVCLEMATDDFLVAHTKEIEEGWGWWNRKKALRNFSEEAKRSVTFAMNFFERRSLDLDEVPEIALLGE